MIRIGNKIVAGSADVDLSTVLKSLNKTGLNIWIGTQTEYDALAESVKNNEKTTFITYDTDEDIYLIVDTIISYGKTWSSVKISSELAKKINASDVYTKEQVDEIINSKLASALKYKGAVNTTALLPASAENGDTYFVKADGFMYAYNSTETDWDALGTVADMTNYFTKTEITAMLQDKADKFQYDVLPTPSSETVGVLLQYTGADTQDYKNGYWYKGVDNGDSTYSWSQDTTYILTKMTIDNCQKVIGKTSFSSNEIVDVNNLQESGIYSVWTSANASNLPRYDYATWWEISVITKSNLHSDYCHQMAIGSNDLVYVRQCDGDVWSSWQKLATTNDILDNNYDGSFMAATVAWFKTGALFTYTNAGGFWSSTFLLSDRDGAWTGILKVADDGNSSVTATIVSLGANPRGGEEFYFDETSYCLYFCGSWDRITITQLTGKKVDLSITSTTQEEAKQNIKIVPINITKTDDIFLVGDRRSVIGWADLTSDVNVDGSSNYANNVGRIDGRNAMILVSNPTPSYQWPVTNSGDRNIFLDFGSYVQFFVDTVNNSLYVRSRDSVDMGNWGAIAMQSMLPEFKDMTTGNADELRSFANNKMYSVKVANAFNVMDDDGNAYQIPALAEAIFYKHSGDITVQFHSYYGTPGIWEIFYNSNGQTRGKKIV